MSGTIFLLDFLQQDIQHEPSPKILDSPCSIEQDREELHFSEYLTKTSILVLNQLKIEHFLTCYSSLKFIFLKMSINIPFNQKLSPERLLYNKRKKQSVKRRVMVAFSRRQRLIKDRYTKHLFFVKKKRNSRKFF